MDRGMDRDTLSGPAFTLWLWRKRAGYFKSSLVLHVPGKAETEGVVIIAPLEVQEAPSGTRTGLTSLQGALAILVVATQLVAFVQLPEAHGGSEPAPAARAGPAGAAAEATAVAAAPGRKMTSSGSSSSTEAAEAAEAAVATVVATVVATGVAVRGPEAVLG